MATPAHILVIDAPGNIPGPLTDLLCQIGYSVTRTACSADICGHQEGRTVDLVILNPLLAHDEGLALCRDLRERCTIPVIALTLRDDESACIEFLESGASDCLSHPFNPRELLARIHAILRRTRKPPNELQPDDIRRMHA